MHSIVFKNSPFLSIRTLIMFGFPILISSYFISSPHLFYTNSVGVFVSLIVMVVIQIFDMYYFQLHSDKITVKHHLFFGFKKDIPFSDIHEIEIHKPQKSSIALRVHYKDGRKKNYSAATLHYPTWRTLIEELYSRNVAVKNLAV